MALLSSNSANSLARYRPALLAFTAIAAGCTIYYIHNIISTSGSATLRSPQQQNTLHRSNARRRGRQRRVTDAQTSVHDTVDSDADAARPLADGAHEGPVESQLPRIEPNGGESEVLALFETRIPGNQRGETVADAESEHSWRGDAEADEVKKEGQSLLNLLYRIAEEQARKDGYVHRGVTCNSCNVMPIRGIRYRCANCIDFDLCEQCEALQVHPKTHLFYKVRVPAPFLGNPRQPQPVWYPGKPTAVVHNLPIDALRDFCKTTGFQIPEIEALWEQFRCLAATEWIEDPNHYHLAIDRQTFDKCFVPNTSTRPPPPNLIYDRLFAFYDANGDGLIGFDEFLKGLASLNKKNLDERRNRIFNGYDINQDGYVNRKDFLRMFRANYALTKELLREVVSSLDDEMFDWSGGARDIVVSSQPISSAFSGSIQPGEQSRTGEGKTEDGNGDYVISDNIGTVKEEGTDTGDHNESVADRAESAALGDVQEDLAKDLEQCRSMLNQDMSDIAWPPDPDFLIFDDGCKALDKSLDWFWGDRSGPLTWNRVRDPMDRRKILSHALHRLETLQTMQHSVRQEGIYGRWRRRQFFLEDENGVVPPDGFERQERLSPPNSKRQLDDPSFTRAAALDAILKAEFADEFRTSITMKLQSIKWPSLDTFHSGFECSHKVLDMVAQGWTADLIAEAISDFAPGFSDAMKFVLWLFLHIKDSERRLEKGVTSESPFESLPPSRRSRSSSKVRFQDDVATDDEHETRSATSMSSRSIPMGERWGGYEIPEAEKDVGREVLYQVTQEAFNELLDPIFSLREELAIRAMRTRAERKTFRAALDTLKTTVDRSHIQSLVDEFQKNWYATADQMQNDEPINEPDIIIGFRMKSTGEVQDIQHKLEALYKSGEQLGMSIDQAQYSYTQRPPDLSEGHPDLVQETAESKREFTEPTQEQDETDQQTDENHQDENIHHEETTITIIAHNTTYDPNAPPPLNEPEVAPDLHHAVTAFNDADPSLEASIAQKPLDELLAASGYAPIAPPPQSTQPPDPTLPQNRPTRITPPTPSHFPSKIPLPTPKKPSSKPKPPSLNRLKHLLAMDYVEEEDERRGGPGRISQEEFEILIRNGKGQGLGFLGDWIDKANF